LVLPGYHLQPGGARLPRDVADRGVDVRVPLQVGPNGGEGLGVAPLGRREQLLIVLPVAGREDLHEARLTSDHGGASTRDGAGSGGPVPAWPARGHRSRGPARPPPRPPRRASPPPRAGPPPVPRAGPGPARPSPPPGAPPRRRRRTP